MKLISLFCLLSIAFAVQGGSYCHTSSDELDAIESSSGYELLPEKEFGDDFFEGIDLVPDYQLSDLILPEDSFLQCISGRLKNIAVLCAVRLYRVQMWVQEKLKFGKN